ncbi:MAG: DNA polymerase III subunit gamma/tau, partial [Oceanospirillales bacterium]|nr:DNA polymerase III subunit gamma/tau [Oceanospirillales bacterium]
SSFNALLKTLEEPPPHVKFLLATTDPQKLPMTVLSRCLQFNLKNLTAERIQQHLEYVLQEESIPCEVAALWLLARSADGSMRDALSLTDQAIAFGAGAVNEADVRSMLGTIDQQLVYRIMEHVAAHQPQAVLEAVYALAEFSPDYHGVLGDIVSLLHRVALAQVVPAAVDNSLGDREQILALAQQMRAEEVQLYYQVALMGRKDLPLVPEPREGLEMTLLRMLAFRPADAEPLAASAATAVTDAAPAARSHADTAAAPVSTPTSAPKAAPAPMPRAEPQPAAPPLDDVPPWEELPADLAAMGDAEPKKSRPADVKHVQPAAAPLNRPVSSAPEGVPEASIADPGIAKGEAWALLLQILGLSGMAESLARNLSLEVEQDDLMRFHYMPEQEALLSGDRRERISDAIRQVKGDACHVEFIQAAQTRETPAQRAERKRVERLAEAVVAIETDATVQILMEHFGATIERDSVRPID